MWTALPNGTLKALKKTSMPEVNNHGNTNYKRGI
jgi:hypothetical protein